MKNSLRNLTSILALGTLLMVSSASAALEQYHLVWSGTNFANTAVADGVMTIDTALFPNPGSSGGIAPIGAGTAVVALTITVSGASAGNGTFTTPDFDQGWAAEISLPINFDVEWVGQPGFNDLNFFSIIGAPNGAFGFALAPAGSVDEMELVSVTPVLKQNFAKGDRVPGLTTNDVFKSFGMPAINDDGVTAFIGKWSTNIGIFANGALVTKVGDTLSAPSGTVTIKSLGDPVIDSSNHVAFVAKFTDLSAGVVSTAPFGTLNVVAQTGQQAADAPAGAKYGVFTSVSLPGAGRGALILGKMTVGGGGITSANAMGVWATQITGTNTLMLQAGTTVIGGTNQVKTFKALLPSAGVSAQTRSFNGTGSLAALITYTNGAQAVVTLPLP